MENNGLVSIIVNCFNSDRYLRQAIDSVISQTYSNWELIFWDNQSTDHSAEIVHSYSDFRIRYFYADQHTSLGDGRNCALKEVRGRYVSFLDADDFYTVDRLQVVVDAFDTDIDFIYSNGKRFNQTTGLSSPFYKKIQKDGDMFEYWLGHYNVMIPSVVFRSSVLNEMKSHVDPRFSMVEEYDFFLRMVKGRTVKYIHNELCTWRCHSESLTWKKSMDWSNEFFILRDKLKVLYDPNFDFSELDKKIAIHSFVTHVSKGKIDRKLIVPYVTSDFRIFVLYYLSYLGPSKLEVIIGKYMTRGFR